MTDNEIIKALECCSKDLGCTKGCPFLDDKNGNFKCKVATPYGNFEKILLDLINRQQAEIERLTAEARAKATKEVLDEITERLHEAEMHGNYEPSLTIEIINDIKKKMRVDNE